MNTQPDLSQIDAEYKNPNQIRGYHSKYLKYYKNTVKTLSISFKRRQKYILQTLTH